jgi:heptosyltransferase III
MPDGQPKILVIRRDNIGDLVCTTPLLRGLREKMPDAWLGLLANSYNAPVLAGNPHLDEIFTYQKTKHRAAANSVVALYWARLKLILQLRARRLDYVILAAPAFQRSALRFARLVGARHLVGYADPHGVIDLALPLPHGEPQHQVEAVYALGRFFGLEPPAPPLVLRPDTTQVARINATLPERHGNMRVGVHLSAREADRRWPAQHFIGLCRGLITRGCEVILTWAPGGRNNRFFPGDDETAREVATAVAHPALLVCPTDDLAALGAAISLGDLQISSDGGPVHLAAGLGKPVLCFFGEESPAKWHPWGVKYALIRKPSRRVADITVEEALAEFDELRKSCISP